MSYWVFVVLDFLFVIRVQLEDCGCVARFMRTAVLMSHLVVAAPFEFSLRSHLFFTI